MTEHIQKGIADAHREVIANAEPSVHEADEALIAIVRITQQAQKAARIEAIVREPDQ